MVVIGLWLLSNSRLLLVTASYLSENYYLMKLVQHTSVARQIMICIEKRIRKGNERDGLSARSKDLSRDFGVGIGFAYPENRRVIRFEVRMKTNDSPIKSRHTANCLCSHMIKCELVFFVGRCQ